ncbi:MAG: DMT family transporter [Roseburia sp.]|nr:DMT family transporter [Roseburia sp.]
MKTRQFTHSFLLVLTAFIWGVAFVAQSTGGDAMGPYSFNCIRMLIGGVILLPVTALLDRIKPGRRKPETGAQRRTLFLGGSCCGIILFCASTLQQVGIYMGTGAGKAGFLTACYILLVPIFGLLLRKKCGWNIWVGVLLTLCGLYLLCMNGSLRFRFSDLLVLLCAVCFALHILVIDYFSPLVDGVRMSCIQFLTCGILGLVPAFFVDMGHSLEGIAAWAPAFTSLNAWIPLLYAGVLSCGVAYTLQIIGQEGVNPAVASLLMSLESVFSVIAGWMILGQKLNSRELAGCVLIFAAVVLAQIPLKKQ